MKDFFNKLETELYNAIKADMAHILAHVGNEKIYSVALVTDEDCISLYLAANTSEYLRKKDLDNLKFMRQYLSEEKIRAVEDGTDSLTRWAPAEWGYSAGTESKLAAVSKLLFEQEERNLAEYAKSKPLFFETISSALKRAIDEKTANAADVTFFITLSDGDGIEAIENHSAQILNSADVYGAFLHRFDGNQ